MLTTYVAYLWVTFFQSTADERACGCDRDDFNPLTAMTSLENDQ